MLYENLRIEIVHYKKSEALWKLFNNKERKKGESVRMYLCLTHVSLYCRYIVVQLIDSSVANSSTKTSAPAL